MEIPLFPLHAVLVPGAPLPLHVFEPRYRALVDDCLATGSPFGVVCLVAGREVGAGKVSFAAVGTLASIRDVDRHPDGRLDIVAVGAGRFRLTGVDATSKPYLVGTGILLPELLGDPARVARLAARVRSRFARYLELLGADEGEADEGAAAGRDDEPPADATPAGAAAVSLGEIAARIAPPDDPATLAHVVSGLVEAELPRRQRLLEAETAEDRLAELDALLAREIALLARRLAPYVADPRLQARRGN